MRHRNKYLFLSLIAVIGILAFFESLKVSLTISLAIAAIPVVIYSTITGIKDYKTFFLRKKPLKNNQNDIYRIIISEPFIPDLYKKRFAEICANDALDKSSFRRHRTSFTELDSMGLENSSFAFKAL